MEKRALHTCCIFLMLLLAGCDQAPKDKNLQTDTPLQGTIRISVDESFKPVIQEEIKVYEVSHPNAHLLVSYKSEADCFRDIQKDSTRMIIVARGLKKEETTFFENTVSFRPQYDIVAYDAVAVIINAKAKDSVFTLEKLKNILSGKIKITAVMDGRNATSTVRYLEDSLMRGTAFGDNVVAANGSAAVVEIVSKTEDAIGLVGLSWVGDMNDPKQAENLKKIHLALVECVKCEEKGMFAKPSQATITYAQYPLARPLYYIVKENATGLGTGFANFMSLERGQLIFRRATLVPAKINFKVRGTGIKEQ